MKPHKSIFFWAYFLLNCACYKLAAYHGAYSYVSSYVNYENLSYSYNLAKSMVTFYPSFTYNWVIHGTSYSFDLIMPSGKSVGNLGLPSVIRNADGTIRSIDDGGDIPILLGGIPYNQQHLDSIKKAVGLEKFTIFSLNLDYERRWSNWQNLIKNDQSIRVKIYPTVDFSAPSRVDMVRLVLDLHDRLWPVLVQCKAGKGRSAASIGAYLMVVAFRAHDQVSVDEIEQYLRMKRPRVEFNHSHRQALVEFRAELIKWGQPDLLLATIRENYKDKIAEREREISANFCQLWQHGDDNLLDQEH